MSDKHSIWNLVKELLHEHDCVIVPGFGGFVCNREPAKIDQVSNMITPPGKHIVFNQSLKVNDGLLATKASEKLGLTYIESVQFIDACVNEAKQVLQEKKHLLVELFGSFRLNAEANYIFQPDKFNNYLIASYGLAPVQANAVASRAIKHTRILRNRKPFQEAKQKSQTIWPTVLVSTLVLLLVVNGWVFLRKHSLNEMHVGNISAMSITTWFDSLFHKEAETPKAVEVSKPLAEQPQITPPVSSAEPSIAPTDSSIIESSSDNISSAGSVPQEQPVFDLGVFAQNIAMARPNWYIPVMPGNSSIDQQQIITNESPSINSDSSYHIITGVFCKQRNVKRYLSTMIAKGYHAEPLLSSGKSCKRISLGQFHSRQEAETFLSTVRSSETPDAWLLALSN